MVSSMEWKHFTAVLVWFVLTGAVNYMMRTKTADEWEALAEQSPRYAAFARMLRAIGLDPVKLIQAGADLIRGQAKKATGEADSSSNDNKKESGEK